MKIHCPLFLSIHPRAFILQSHSFLFFIDQNPFEWGTKRRRRWRKKLYKLWLNVWVWVWVDCLVGFVDSLFCWIVGDCQNDDETKINWLKKLPHMDILCMRLMILTCTCTVLKKWLMWMLRDCLFDCGFLIIKIIRRIFTSLLES